jgi:hypothetical protein
MKPFYILSIFSLLNYACKTSSTIPVNHHEEKLDNGNKIIIKADNSYFPKEEGDKVIIEGQNNTIEYDYKNVFLNKKISDVIIYKGNNNHVVRRYINVTMAELENNKRDTIVIELGDNQEVEILVEKGKNPVIRPLVKEGGSIKLVKIAIDTFRIIPNNFPSKIDIDDKNIDTSAVIFYQKLDRNIKLKEALSIIQTDANKGEPEALYILGNFYFNGIGGVKQNTAKGLQFYQQAASKNYTQAQFTLGSIYEEGELDVSKDIKKAILYYKMAARNGMEEAKKKVKELEQ